MIPTKADGSKWTPRELAEVLGRSVIDGLIEGRLTPEQAYQKARLAGSFARLHLERDGGGRG